MFQPDLLKGKRILVTGGGTGLGRSMAHRYLELGANVVICGRTFTAMIPARSDCVIDLAMRSSSASGNSETA